MPQAASRSTSASAVAMPTEALPIEPKTPTNETVPNVLNIRKIAMSRPVSPTRFMMNAFFAAVAAAGRSLYQAISRYDARPTPSQPKYRTTKLLPSTSSSIAAMNRFMYAKNRRLSGSCSM